ncbi:MAG: 50S ribosomal protein L17, partial [Armatimonadetes bacterium]|nr:50S ribosomal protein L17 [Armatimonadota bacterium]
MRHRVAGRKLGLPSDQRMALLRGLVRSLIMYEAIETTEPRAKEARVIAEKLISLTKQNSVHAKRQ